MSLEAADAYRHSLPRFPPHPLPATTTSFSTGKLGTETQSSIEGSTVEGGTEFYECSDAEHQKRA